MEIKEQRSLYTVSETYTTKTGSGTEVEQEVRVMLEIDYNGKSFSILPIKNTTFNFERNILPERVIAISNAIRNAAEYAKIKLEQ